MKNLAFLLLSAVIFIACDTSESDKKAARSFLETEAKAGNALLEGTQIDAATYCDGCQFKNDDFHYYYIIDEDILSISTMKANKDNLKEAQRTSLENIPQSRMLIENLKKLNGKIVYHYTGTTTDETLKIEIEF